MNPRSIPGNTEGFEIENNKKKFYDKILHVASSQAL